MSIKTDKIQLVVGVDTKDGIRNLGYLQEQYQRLAQAQKVTKSYTESQNQNNSMLVLKEQIAEIRKEYGIAAFNAKELSQYQRDLVSERSKFSYGTDQYKEVDFELQKVTQRIKDIRNNTEEVEKEQALLRAELQKTIQEYGTEALSVTQLKKLQEMLYTEMVRGAKSGNLANAEQVKSYQQVAIAVSKAEAELSKNTIVEKANIQAVLAAVKANGIMSLSLNDMKAYHKALTEQIAESADFESQVNQQRIKEAQQVANTIENREKNVKGTSGLFDSLKSQLPAALVGGLAGGIAGFVTSKIDDIIGTVKEKFEEGIKYIKKQTREITEIETTLNISLFDATKIDSQLIKIDTERPREQLKELVLVAGDLNVATKDVIKFTESADKLEKVFERDFGGVGQASTEIAKLKETYKETKDLKIDESFDKIGSSIKVLNEAGPATTKGITEFLSRIGQLPDAFKPAIQDAAALASVMEEANLTAEISSGGITNLLLTGSKNADVFSKFFGQSKKDFLDFLTTDPIGFLTQFAEKYKNLADSEKGEIFKVLKIESQETVKTVGVISDNLEKFYEKQKISNKAFTEGTRIGEIFSVFNNDDAAEITKAEKKIESFYNKITGFFGTLGKSVLVSFAQLLPDTASKVETLTKKFDEQEKITKNLEKNYTPLLKRIEELKSKSNLSKTEQNELNTAIKQVADGIPSAVTAWDKYANALDINTGAARRNIIEQRKLARELKQETITELSTTISKTKKDLENNQASLNYVQSQIQKYGTNKTMENRLNQLKDENKFLAESLIAGERSYNALKFDYKYVDQPTTNSKTDNSPPTLLPTGDDKNKTGEDKAKKAAEQYRKEIDMLAEITFKRDQAIADEENKKVLAAERQAQTQELSIKKEIENEKRRKEALALNEKELIDAVTTIRAEYQLKREKQIAEQATKAIEIAQKRALTEKQLAVATAEASNDDFQIYNAKFSLNQQLASQELASLEAKYAKEQESLKGNNAALQLAEQNHTAEVLAIKAKYIAEDDKLLMTLLKNTKDKKDKEVEIKRKAEIEKRQLDLQEAEQTPGGNVLQAKLSLLNAQMVQELSVTKLTEEEKNNIIRKYDLQRSSLQIQSFRDIAAQGLQLFGEAFSSISGLFTDRIQREEEEENQKFQKTSDRLEQEKEQGILTDAEYKRQKTATEKVHEKELRRIKYDQAKTEKANNITQATINGIQAVMKGYSQTGPLGGTALAIIMGAISALQIGRIAATPLPSLFGGGPTPDRIERPIDSLGGFLAINHPGEYMVPKFVRETPIFAAIEPMLESIRSSGRSFYDGGPVDSTIIASAKTINPFGRNPQTEEALLAAIQELNRQFPLRVFLGGHDYEIIQEGLNENANQNNDAIITT